MRVLLYAAIVSIAPALCVVGSPEFMQQYRQRIGGHASELRATLRDFDADARRSNLTRVEALRMMEAKPEKFFKERAERIKGYEQRLVRLEEQEEMLLHRASPFTIVDFYRNYDEQIYQETSKSYAWAINNDGILLALIFWIMSFAALGGLAILLSGRSNADA